MKKNVFCIFLLLPLLVCAQIPKNKKIVSSLYIYDLAKQSSTLILKEKRHFEAPNWSVDGRYLLINSKGLLEKVSLDGKEVTPLKTSFIKQANNDHGFSFDGQILFISSAKKEIKEHSSFIYKFNLSNGTAELITPLSPSYWHGVSPDGQDIVYCAQRNGNYDVYKMNIETKKEIRLTFSEGLDDGPEYAPDGSFIYINSFRSGRMQIWRIQPDGSNPEQMTFDNYSNWFPHISPDSNSAVIISYLEDQKQAHPFGKMVKLRLLNLKTKKVTDLTSPFFGGQGTINVRSWNPSGTQFAYVKYELVD